MQPIVSPQHGLPLALTPSPSRQINEHVGIYNQDGQEAIFAHGMPLFHYGEKDRASRRLGMAMIFKNKLATEQEIAVAYGCHRTTVYRNAERLVKEGLKGFSSHQPGPKGAWKVTPRKEALAKRHRKRGLSYAKIGKQLDLSIFVVRRIIENAGEANGKGGSVAAAPLSVPEAQEPVDRTLDRALARLGKILEAPPEFVRGCKVAFSGSLLVLPAMVAGRFYATLERTFGSQSPGFYGLKTTMTVLALMAAIREPRAEGLTRRPPEAVGRLVGLDRVPEVKTLRRKLSEMAAHRKGLEWMGALAKEIGEKDGESLGYLYVDGHVRVYTGKERLSKAYVTQRRLSVPAEVDTWVNDQNGEPLLFWRGKPSAQLVSEMDSVMKQVREVVGADRRVTVVFDRGGWSPKLFQKMLGKKFDFITYRKGLFPQEPISNFEKTKIKIDEQDLEYLLADRGIHLKPTPKSRLRVRQVTRVKKNGKQTAIVTSRLDLKAGEVAYRMLARWRQENFFKYMEKHFEIDALEEYGSEQDDPTRTVPNPEHKEVGRKIAKVKAEMAKLEMKYGQAAVNNKEGKRRTIRGFKIAHGELGRAIRECGARLKEHEAQRKQLPTRVPLSQAQGDKEIKRLKNERKRLTNIVKMAVYRAETSLWRAIGPHYARGDEEGRSLLREAFHSAGDIIPEPGERRLRIQLEPLSAPRRTRALQALCDVVNETKTCFPGTGLVLHFEVQGSAKNGS